MFIQHVARCKILPRAKTNHPQRNPKVKRENLHRGAAFSLTKTNDGNKARRFPSPLVMPCVIQFIAKKGASQKSRVL